jgi:hypothetical protein
MKYVAYCPYCGVINTRAVYEDKVPFCKHCGSREPLVNLPKEDTYESLCKQTEELFGADSKPRYNQEIADYIEKEFNRATREFIAKNNAEKQREAAANTPHCPTCGSTNIKKLDVVDRAVSIGTLGIFSNKINKSFKCKDCGCTW